MLRLSHTILCDLDAYVNITESDQHCPVVTIVDKNDDRQCLYLWGVLEVANLHYE